MFYYRLSSGNKNDNPTSLTNSSVSDAVSISPYDLNMTWQMFAIICGSGLGGVIVLSIIGAWITTKIRYKYCPPKPKNPKSDEETN